MNLKEIEKEQNSFNKFGFETPEFEGEILKKIKYGLIGCVDSINGYMAIEWNEHGTSFYGEKRMEAYNLTPLKKPWYENEDKFPCLCYLKSIDQNIESFEVLSDINEYKSYNKKFTVRPATKEEVLKLVVDED